MKAYVANRRAKEMREELKGRNLTFTEIAKLVGENWQSLSQSEKEPFESQAQAIKDKYHSDLAEYKKTSQYKKYMVYLQEFKAKHATLSQGTYMYPGHCCSTTTRGVYLHWRPGTVPPGDTQVLTRLWQIRMYRSE